MALQSFFSSQLLTALTASISTIIDNSQWHRLSISQTQNPLFCQMLNLEANQQELANYQFFNFLNLFLCS